MKPPFLARVKGQTHGGVAAAVGPRRFLPLDALVAGRERPFIVMLDGIEDPFNFGQALRALYAAGVDGVVVRPRNWFSAAGVVARASAGVSEQMPMAIAETAEQAADTFRQLGLKIAATSNQQAVSLYDATLTMPLFLLLGGRKAGRYPVVFEPGRFDFADSLPAAQLSAVAGGGGLGRNCCF